jgi:hypothetical protein
MKNRPTVKISPCCCPKVTLKSPGFRMRRRMLQSFRILRFRNRDCHGRRQHRWPRERSWCQMPDTAFATDFRQISFGIRPKSVPAPRNQNMSQSLSQWSVRNPRIREPVLPGTAATAEDADKAEDHGPCEMLCEAFARLPQEHSKSLKCGVAHPHPREPNSPPARQGHDTACFFARRTFLQ